MRDMLSVYIRPPASLDLMEQPFPLMREIGRRFAAAKGGELRRGVDPEQGTQLFLTSLFGLVASSREPLSERRDELRQLAALFLESPRRVARRS